MKRKKIAMLLAMALTLTQGVGATVPVAAEELGTDIEQEIQDDDAEVTVEADDFAAEDEAEAEIQDDTEEVQDVDFSAGDESIEAVGEEKESGDEDGDEEEKYDLQIWFEDTRGDKNILPGSKKNLCTSLSDDEGEEVSDYTIEVFTEKDKETGEDYSERADYEVSGKNILVTAHNITGYVECTIKASIDGEVVAEEPFGFRINDYVISSEADIVNPEVGESFNITDVMNPKLVHYENGISTEESDYKITILDYDEDGWERSEEEPDSLILTRTTSDSTYFSLQAMKQGENGEMQWIATRFYSFDSLDDGGDGDNEDHDDDSEQKSPYELQIDYVDTIGNSTMLPNSKMTIVTKLLDKTNGYSTIDDYKLELIEQSKFGTMTVDEEGKKLSIESGDKIGSGCCYVAVKIPDENGEYQEVFKKDIGFEVNNHMLSPQILKDKSGNILNPKVGESVNLAELGIGLLEYREGKLVPVGDQNLKIVVYCETRDGEEPYVDYDTNGWEMKEVEGQDLPIMTRITKDATWFAVTALERIPEGGWEHITRKEYCFDAVSDSTDEHVHTVVTDAAVAPTCTTAGKTEGSHCSVCNEVLKAQRPIPAKGHTVVKDAAVAPTVFADGKTEGSHCSVCGTVIEKQNTIAKVPGTIYLTASSLKMKVGQSTTAFKATGFSEGDYVTAVTSDKPGTVKVTNVKNNGTFKLTAGKKAGSAVITVMLASKKTASFKVTVQKAAVKTTKIATDTKTLTLTKGATYKKLASSIAVTPVTSKEKITYTSSNKKVATVSSKGVIKAKKAGTAKITVKSGSKKVVVTVKVTGVKTTKLSGVPAAKTVSKGKTFKIKAAATPKNTDEKIAYTSSNKKVATVTSKGVVKGLRKGTATITVRSGSQKMTCKVTVK